MGQARGPPLGEHSVQCECPRGWPHSRDSPPALQGPDTCPGRPPAADPHPGRHLLAFGPSAAKYSHLNRPQSRTHTPQRSGDRAGPQEGTQGFAFEGELIMKK